jgi:polyhydroxyalkanoate synthesis repressor PhaR
MTAAHPSEKQLDIRKYPNRRYYDATHSRHLTLEEIRSLIRDGYDIRVTDSKTGADITAQVLTQIILELETGKIDSFPVNLLLRVIRSNDQLVRDFVETYFNQAFGAYLEYQKQLEERLRQAHGMGGIFPPYATWAQAMLAPFAPNSSAESSPQPRPAAGSDLREVITDLQNQVAGLQEALRRKRARPRRPRTAQAR